MPFLLIKTNIDLDDTVSFALTNYASKVVAEALGKPESYVMINVCPGQYMSMGAKTAPCVYMELESVALPQTETARLSQVLTKMVGDRLNVPGNRVYTVFRSVPGNMWGYNGSTF